MISASYVASWLLLYENMLVHIIFHLDAKRIFCPKQNLFFACVHTEADRGSSCDQFQFLNKMLCFQLIIESLLNVLDEKQKFLMSRKMALNFRERILINFLQCKIIENILVRRCCWQSMKFMRKWKISMKIPCNYLPVPLSSHVHECSHTASHIRSQISVLQRRNRAAETICCAVSFHKHHTFTQPATVIVNFHAFKLSAYEENISELEMSKKYIFLF